MYCPDRPNISKEVLENEFKELIEKMKVPKPVFDEYKSILMEERQLLKNGKSISIPQLQ